LIFDLPKKLSISETGLAYSNDMANDAERPFRRQKKERNKKDEGVLAID